MLQFVEGRECDVVIRAEISRRTVSLQLWGVNTTIASPANNLQSHRQTYFCDFGGISCRGYENVGMRPKRMCWGRGVVGGCVVQGAHRYKNSTHAASLPSLLSFVCYDDDGRAR